MIVGWCHQRLAWLLGPVPSALSTRSPTAKVAFAVGGHQVAVFRKRDGSLRALSAVCSHKGGPIADGQIDNTVVLCPLHMNAFELTPDARPPAPHRCGPIRSTSTTARSSSTCPKRSHSA